jgi:hypothetical protein
MTLGQRPVAAAEGRARNSAMRHPAILLLVLALALSPAIGLAQTPAPAPTAKAAPAPAPGAKAKTPPSIFDNRRALAVGVGAISGVLALSLLGGGRAAAVPLRGAAGAAPAAAAGSRLGLNTTAAAVLGGLIGNWVYGN